MYTVYELPRCVVTGLLYMLCVIEQCVDIIHVQMILCAFVVLICTCIHLQYLFAGWSKAECASTLPFP